MLTLAALFGMTELHLQQFGSIAFLIFMSGLMLAAMYRGS